MPQEATALFESPAILRRELLRRLADLACTGEPGFLVTALGNALVLPYALPEVGAELRRAFDALLERWRERLLAGEPVGARHDEIDTILRIALIGWDALRPVERRMVGPWAAQFNLMRAFRPRRAARPATSQVCVPRTADEFGFHDERLRPERLGSEELAGRETRAYLNRYPYAGMHLLLVPDADRLLPQSLDADLVRWAWDSLAAIGRGIPGAVLGWNSMGAFASVNHAHFHLVIEPEELPIQHPRWTVNGGATEYPAEALRYDAPDDAWEHIRSLQNANTPFNALFAPGRVYVYPRPFEAATGHAAWTTGFAFHELSGSIVVTRRAPFLSLSENQIVAELARCRRSVRRVSGTEDAEATDRRASARPGSILNTRNDLSTGTKRLDMIQPSC